MTSIRDYRLPEKRINEIRDRFRKEDRIPVLREFIAQLLRHVIQLEATSEDREDE